MMFGGKRETVSTEYSVVKHNDNLFSVMSTVTTKDQFGCIRKYENFCGEATSEDAAKDVILKIKRAI